jgi:hypothetical protein
VRKQPIRTKLGKWTSFRNPDVDVAAVSVTPSEPIPEEATQMPKQSGFTRTGGFAIETSQNLGEYFAIFYNVIKEA